MTLDEAIIHAECEAWKNEREADRCFRHGGSTYEEKAKSCKACSEEHRQLAEWLKELKAYRADRKTENCSEKPNNCEDEPQTDIHDFTDCDFCKERKCKDCEGGKDEPQTDRRMAIGKRSDATADKYNLYGKTTTDEPQTETKAETQNSNLTFEKEDEPQYDFGEYADRLWKIAYERGKREALEQTEPSCDTCKLKDTTEWCKRQEVCRAYQPKDEPQTERGE